jgi:hypothetical protein
MKMSSHELESEIVEAYNESKSLESVRKKFKMCVKTIKEILRLNGVQITMRKQPLDIEYFKEIDTPEKAYWLGFIAADGHLSKTKYKLAFCVKDSDILYKLRSAIGAGSPVRNRKVLDKRTNKENEQYNIQINSKEFCQYIKNHGVDENKSKIFNFPNLKKKLHSHFVRGLYDGDGSIHIKKSKVKNKPTCRINLISTFECISYIKDYLETFMKFNVQHIFSKPDQNIHYISIQKGVIDFLEWIYKDSTAECRLDRKYAKYEEYKKMLDDRKPSIIKNHISGIVYETFNMTQFCREFNLNDNLLRTNFKKGKVPKSGRHAGWELVKN